MPFAEFSWLITDIGRYKVALKGRGQHASGTLVRFIWADLVTDEAVTLLVVDTRDGDDVVWMGRYVDLNSLAIEIF